MYIALKASKFLQDQESNLCGFGRVAQRLMLASHVEKPSQSQVRRRLVALGNSKVRVDLSELEQHSIKTTNQHHCIGLRRLNFACIFHNVVKIHGQFFNFDWERRASHATVFLGIADDVINTNVLVTYIPNDGAQGTTKKLFLDF